MHRRTFLASAASAAAAAAPKRTPVAAIITCYFRNSHADVFIGNIFRGFWWEGKRHESEIEIPAMYLEQTPATDIGVAEAAKHGVIRKPTVAVEPCAHADRDAAKRKRT